MIHKGLVMNEINRDNAAGKLLEKGVDMVSWRSPSNIALVKYWGKHGRQLPRNPSISFTLSEAHTETQVKFKPLPKGKTTKEPLFQFQFEGRPRPDFVGKISSYLQGLMPVFPFLKAYELFIDSSNTFPHSAGIASSASGMSALALCLCSIEHRLQGKMEKGPDFFKKASYLSRLGSGSACRSVYPGLAAWGKSEVLEGSSDEFAIPCREWVNSVFLDFCDDILIISKQEKSVSSRAGHQLMEDNPFAPARYQQANENLTALLNAMKTGDLEQFGAIVEQEALSLHALMMTSSPPYVLMEPNSLAVIQAVRQFRKESKTPLFFTLDAGPNIHLLYPASEQGVVRAFMEEELVGWAEEKRYIADKVGQGPLEL